MGVLYEEEKYSKKKSKSGQIPAFGNWDYANEQPITQYFESARQAGLIRFSYSSGGDSGEYYDNNNHHHLYALHCKNYTTNRQPPLYKAKIPQVKEYRRQSLKQEKRSNNKGEYLTEPPMPEKLANNNKGGGATCAPPGKKKQNASNIINAKAVDEDLYKIPPELLHSSKRKKRLGFFSRCFVSTCMV